MVLPLKSFNDTQMKTFQFFKLLLLNNIYIYIKKKKKNMVI